MRKKSLLPLFSVLTLILLTVSGFAAIPPDPLKVKVDALADQVEKKVIQWRRDFHEHPELSNREFETSKKVAAHLSALGIEVKTGVAHTGVVGLLKGGKPGPVVALRADMDALPVPERTGLPFASKVRAEFNGQEVSVMHACGHDVHTAILMGVAEVLAGISKDLPGTVKFIFQPSEEGAPAGEEGGADLMVKEGVLLNPKPEVIFGLHIKKEHNVGEIGYRPGGFMAAADRFVIKIHGKQTHGSTPWTGVDPIVVAAQMVNAIQTIVSRQVNLVDDAAVVSVGSIHGGLRFNIIPEEVELVGTIRTLNIATQDRIHERLRATVKGIAESAGATAEVEIQKMCPVTFNHAEVTAKMLPTLQAVAGRENVILDKAIMGAEDFAFYQQEIPGLYFFVGATPKGENPAAAPSHHTPEFFVDESGMKLGVRALCHLTLEYMQQSDQK